MAGNGDGGDSGRGGGQNGHGDKGERDLQMWDRELGGYGSWAKGEPDPSQLPGPPPSRRTKGIYLAMMATCLGLCAIAWAIVSRYSTTAAVAMSVVALVIPPFAAIIANAASSTDRRRLALRVGPAGYPATLVVSGRAVRALRTTCLIASRITSGSPTFR